MNMETVTVFIDEKGMQMLKMPNGDVIPGVFKTTVEQDAEQANTGTCTVTVIFTNAIVEPSK
jgi:hypothetical protein